MSRHATLSPAGITCNAPLLNKNLRPRALKAAVFGAPRSARTQHERRPRFVAEASIEDLMQTVEKNPEDKGAVLGIAAELKSPPEECLAQIDGSWVVSWTDLGKGWLGKILMGLFTPTLKMLSFGALPNIKVSIVDSYNRVEGDKYDLLQVFELPDSEIVAAMVLEGTCAPDELQTNRLKVQFESVRVVTPLDPPDRCTEALQEAGLSPGVSMDIDAKPTYIDIDYIDNVARVHKGQSGTTYILARLKGIDDPIPFAL